MARPPRKDVWVYLNHPRVFLSSDRLNQADHLSVRYWRRRIDLPAKKADLSHPTRDLLRQEISKYFDDKQGRGRDCTVEVYLRREKIHYFFCYPSDYAETALVYDDQGKIGSTTSESCLSGDFRLQRSDRYAGCLCTGG